MKRIKHNYSKHNTTGSLDTRPTGEGLPRLECGGRVEPYWGRKRGNLSLAHIDRGIAHWWVGGKGYFPLTLGTGCALPQSMALPFAALEEPWGTPYRASLRDETPAQGPKFSLGGHAKGASLGSYCSSTKITDALNGSARHSTRKLDWTAYSFHYRKGKVRLSTTEQRVKTCGGKDNRYYGLIRILSDPSFLAVRYEAGDGLIAAQISGCRAGLDSSPDDTSMSKIRISLVDRALDYGSQVRVLHPELGAGASPRYAQDLLFFFLPFPRFPITVALPFSRCSLSPSPELFCAVLRVGF
eukprot:Gb_20178 [translate_table: standard]